MTLGRLQPAVLRVRREREQHHGRHRLVGGAARRLALGRLHHRREIGAGGRRPSPRLRAAAGRSSRPSSRRSGLVGLLRFTATLRVPLVTGLALGLTAITVAHGGWEGSPLSGDLPDALEGPLQVFRNVHKVDPTVRLAARAWGSPHAVALASALRGRATRDVGRRTAWLLRAASPPCLRAGARPAVPGQQRAHARLERDPPRAWQQAYDYLAEHQDGTATLVVPGSGFALQRLGLDLRRAHARAGRGRPLGHPQPGPDHPRPVDPGALGASTGWSRQGEASPAGRAARPRRHRLRPRAARPDRGFTDSPHPAGADRRPDDGRAPEQVAAFGRLRGRRPRDRDLRGPRPAAARPLDRCDPVATVAGAPEAWLPLVGTGLVAPATALSGGGAGLVGESTMVTDTEPAPRAGVRPGRGATLHGPRGRRALPHGAVRARLPRDPGQRTGRGAGSRPACLDAPRARRGTPTRTAPSCPQAGPQAAFDGDAHPLGLLPGRQGARAVAPGGVPQPRAGARGVACSRSWTTLAHGARSGGSRSAPASGDGPRRHQPDRRTGERRALRRTGRLGRGPGHGGRHDAERAQPARDLRDRDRRPPDRAGSCVLPEPLDPGDSAAPHRRRRHPCLPRRPGACPTAALPGSAPARSPRGSQRTFEVLPTRPRARRDGGRPRPRSPRSCSNPSCPSSRSARPRSTATTRWSPAGSPTTAVPTPSGVRAERPAAHPVLQVGRRASDHGRTPAAGAVGHPATRASCSGEPAASSASRSPVSRRSSAGRWSPTLEVSLRRRTTRGGWCVPRDRPGRRGTCRRSTPTAPPGRVCGLGPRLVVDGRTLDTAVDGTLADVLSGAPMRLTACAEQRPKRALTTR